MADSDTLWIEFLTSLYADKEEEESNEEEEVNDPEYNISEDVLQLNEEWDLWDDRALKVSDNELDLLLDEDDNEVEVQSIETAIVANNQSIGSNDFNEEHIKILIHQFSQHIQLLTQTYLQSINNNGLESVAQNSKSMLIEINSKSNPLFSSIDIKPAICLINQYPIDKCCKTTKSMTSWRSLPVTKENQKIFVSNPNVFVNPWLLPYCGFYDKRIDKNKCKTLFTLAEDHLIALGLEEFTPLFSLRKCYRYIKQLLLPTKTVDQIRTHIKNIKRRSVANDCNDNPIMFYTINGRAPQTHSGVIDPKLDTYLFCKNSPEWYKKAIKAKDILSDSNQTQTNSNQLTCFTQKPQKFKSGNISQTERKKTFPPQQSPVKQTNFIVKKYRYLNRLTPLKQSLTTVSNTNTRPKKCANDMNFNKIEVIDLTENSDHNICIADSDCSQPIDETNVTNETQHKDNSIQNNDKTNYVNTNEKLVVKPLIENPINEEEVEFDDESDLAALMTASSTITTKNKNKSKTNNDLSNPSLLSINHNKKEGRKSLAVKQRESTLQLLSFDGNVSDSYSQQKEDVLIKNYLEKMQKCLTPENFVQFLLLLTQFNKKRNSEQAMASNGLIKELYHQIEDFLKHLNVSKDIISEFVLFLSAEQAEECGKMFDYLYWKRFFNFVRKLEIYSSVDPQCLQRLLRSLNQLKQNEKNLDKNKIRSTVSRVLNGHSYLMHEFSSLFLDEKPSQYLFEDEDFDVITVDSSDEENNDKNENFDKICFENIKVPECDDEVKYGTNECPCKTCHTDQSQSIGRHCTSCGIRFIGGRVYLTQNHKKLRLAEIQFNENDNNSNKLVNNENIKINDDMNEEDITPESDNELDFELKCDKSNENFSEKKIWTISDDKMLLELCRSKVIEDKQNDLTDEVFEEVAQRLSKDTIEVIARFNKLMELFASEQNQEIDL